MQFYSLSHPILRRAVAKGNPGENLSIMIATKQQQYTRMHNEIFHMPGIMVVNSVLK